MHSVEPANFRQASYWDALLQQSPSKVIEIASTVDQDPSDEAGREALVRASNAAARAFVDLGRLDEARAAAQRAIRSLTSASPAQLRRDVGLSSAVVLAESGLVSEGLAVLDELASADDDVAAGRIEMQRAYILHLAGRLNEALVHLDRSERLIARGDAGRDRLRLHINRGVVLLQQGRFVDAESDFVAAERLAASLGLTSTLALSIGNRAVLAGRSRRLARAVELFRTAESLFDAAGSPARVVATVEIDRAEVMMHSGLVADAVVAARRVVELVAPTGNQMLLGDAQLLVARTELAAGKTASARRSAELAANTMLASGRPEMAPHAESVAAHSELRTLGRGADIGPALESSARTVVRLRDHGWHRHADELALDRVRLAARVGRLELVEDEVERLRAASVSDQRDLALAGLLADALAHRAAGAIDEAISSCVRGLDRLDDIIAETSNLAERSAAIRLGADLSQLAIELCVSRGDAGSVLAAAEGTRARALHDELSELERHRPLTDTGAAQLRQELDARLGDRTLVEWVVADDRVMAVVVSAGSARLVDVADVADVVRARDRVLVHLDLAAAEPDASSVRAVRSAALFSELVLGPLGLEGVGGVVMVPVDLLHGVPWSGMPGLRDRSFVLTPNVQIWLAADRGASVPTRSVGLVVGPEIAGAAHERSSIERHFAASAIASGPGASASALSSMLAGNDFVHVAAHGRFRSDRPLLSTLQLADGDATLDQAVPRRVGARLVILSSCEGGAQGTSDGSEVLGLGSVLLARGASTVVAPLTAVRDLECAEFVAEVHAELAAGEPTACALANVRRRWLADDDLSRWAVASSFSCFGSGATRVAR